MNEQDGKHARVTPAGAIPLRLQPSRQPLEDDDDEDLRQTGRFSASALEPEISYVIEEEQEAGLPRSGERIGEGGRFEIGEELGAGAMSVVYRAIDHKLERAVAVKFLLPSADCAAPQLSSRLRQEGWALAQLSHENIVQIFDLGTRGGLPFLVMELLSGEPLSALIGRGRVPLPRAAEILIDVARGLSHAHERGVVHRDLTPGNVFLLPDGRVKLLDFGLSLSRHPRNLTRGDSLARAGTPAYMSPEQWRGAPLDARADLWACGVLLYEMLTGALPYAAETVQELYAQVSATDPPLTRHPLPDAVRPLLLRTLARDPAARFRGADELLEELMWLHTALPPPATGRANERSLLFEHRQLTLLSGQLPGFLSLSEQLDADELAERLRSLHQQFSAVVSRFGGSIIGGAGGEILACFGLPEAHEDDAQRAVRAGLCLAEHSFSGGGSNSAVQVGVHTGLVMVEDGVDNQLARAALEGEAPTLASWLGGRAAPGAVLISDATHRLVEGLFRIEMQGSHLLQGRSRPIPTYRVHGDGAAEQRFERALAAGLTPLVGRRRELQRLLKLWFAARDGRGQIALLGGVAGSGKSRLLWELGARTGAMTLVGQCWPHLRAVPLHPLRCLLRPTASPDGGSRTAPAIERLLRGAPGAELFEKNDALLALVDRLLSPSRRRPILLALEDLQWADPATLALLDHLQERVVGLPRMLVLTHRPEFLVPWTDTPALQRIEIGPLSDGLTASMVELLDRGQALPAQLAAQLARRGDGIPLFVEELARHAVHKGTPVGGPAGAFDVPAALQDLLRAQLDSFPQSDREVMRVGAALGDAFTAPLLCEVTRLSEAALAESLARLVRGGLLLQEREGALANYRFRLALLREVAYRSLPRSRRKACQDRLAGSQPERT